MIAPYAEPRQGPRAKIERAKEHLAELQRSIIALRGGFDLYTVVAQEELRDGQKYLVPRFKVKKPAPARLSAIAGDVVHNARSALDLIACQCLMAGGNIDYCKFPFGKSEDIFEGEVKKQIKNITPKARRLIHRLKPYKGGNPTLWLLHSLDLLDKHRLLIVVGAVDVHATITPNLRFKPGDQVPFVQLARKREGFLNDGDEVFFPVLPPPFDNAFKHQLTIEIRLGGVEGLPEKSAVKTLAQLVSYVERITDIAERRLY